MLENIYIQTLILKHINLHIIYIINLFKLLKFFNLKRITTKKTRIQRRVITIIITIFITITKWKKESVAIAFPKAL